MPTTKANSRDLPVTSAAEVRRLLGPLDDAAVARILRIHPTLEELEVTARFAEGEGDVVDRAGHPLTGRAARVYEILSSVEDDVEDLERRA